MLLNYWGILNRDEKFNRKEGKEDAMLAKHSFRNLTLQPLRKLSALCG